MLESLDQLSNTLGENQAGFRVGRSGKAQNFKLRDITEQSVEYQVPMMINYINFKRAFDIVHRPSL